MANQNMIDTGSKRIIKTYSYIYKAFFQYSYFVVPLILGIITAFLLQSKETIQRINIGTLGRFATYTAVNGFYKGAKISDEVGKIADTEIDVKILGGELQLSGTTIIGRNNLIVYGGDNGFILPNRAYINTANITERLDYFENPTYDIEKLKNIYANRYLSIPPTAADAARSGLNINDIFLRTRSNNTTTVSNMEEVLKILNEKQFFENDLNPLSVTETTQMDLSENRNKLIRDYNLGCLFGYKLSGIFCDKNVNYFISRLPEISTDLYANVLLDISKKIKDEEQLNNFCSNLMVNVLRKPNNSKEITTIFTQACSSFNERYNKMRTFLNLQNNLESAIARNDQIIPGNLEFNIFKLVSLQQQIYIQHVEKREDISTKTSYLNFVQNLINDKSITIPAFYIDATYYFNNTYLPKIVNEFFLQSINPQNGTELAKINALIQRVNNGDVGIGTRGLGSMVKNRQLIVSQGSVIGPTQPNVRDIPTLFNDFIGLFPSITPIEINQIQGTPAIAMKGRISNGGNIVLFDAEFSFSNNTFFVRKMSTPQNEYLNVVLNSMLSRNTSLELSNALSLVSTYGNSATTTIGICDMIRGSSIGSKINVQSCSGTQAIVNIEDDARVTLTIENGVITKGSSPTPEIQQFLNTSLRLRPVNRDRVLTLLVTIEGIVNELQKKSELEESLSPVGRDLVNRLRDYLGANVISIEQQSNADMRKTEFDINGNKFTGIITVSRSYRLSDLVYVFDINTSVNITGFQLSLIATNRIRLNQFKENPFEYIKGVDANAYNKIIDLRTAGTTR